MRQTRKLALASAAALMAVATAAESQNAVPTPPRGPAPPIIHIDEDGTLHIGARDVPPPIRGSAQLKRAYIAQMRVAIAEQNRLLANPSELYAPMKANPSPAEVTHAMSVAKRKDALDAYPVNVEDTELAGVKVAIFTPRGASPRAIVIA